MKSALPHRSLAVAKRRVSVLMILVLALCFIVSGSMQIRGARHVHRLPSVVLPEPMSSAPSASGAMNSPAAPGRDFEAGSGSDVACVVSCALLRMVVAPSRPVFVHAPLNQGAHFHSTSEQHHHDAADSSVVASESPSPFEAARVELETSAAKAGSALGHPCLGNDVHPAATVTTSHAPWCDAPLWAFKTNLPHQLRRPPRRYA